MMRIHFSNRLEVLREHLLQALAAEAGSPLQAQTVIVPSTAVRRHLSLAIADDQGVCANVRFAYLAQWLWQQIARVVPGVDEQSPLAAEALTWRLYGLLGEPACVDGPSRLQAYLAGADPVMRLELARGLATVFESYVTYRPDWLARWQAGEPALAPDEDGPLPDEAWQAALWRRLAADLGLAQAHPAQAWLEVLQGPGLDASPSADPPARLHVFALPAMPPLHVRMLAGLARRMDVALYVLNPCREYWFEIVDARRLAWLARRGADAAHEVGNRQLAAWGGQTQAHIDTLLEACGDAVIDDAGFVAAGRDTLLARWQDAVLALQELPPGSVRAAPADASVEVHVAHSLAREVEVLHDRLLSAFAADPTLRPGDILVVTPRLDSAVPLIESVFGTAPPGRRIPYTVTGQKVRAVSEPARVLLDLLALLGSRLPATELLGLLQRPAVARRFGLDAETLDGLRQSLQAAGFRWGLDAGHRADFGLPATPRHTLRDAIDRLFLGHAVPVDDAEPLGDRLPVASAGGALAGILGALWHLETRLHALHRHCARPRTPREWAGLLLAAVEDFMQLDDEDLDDWRELRGTVHALVAAQEAAALAEPLPLAVVRAALAEALEAPARGGVAGGGVTFAAMGSLRGLPWRRVCFIGLDDGAFPTQGRPAEFDLMAARPRRGDRQRHRDERNLFLDLLLSARDAVHLSYTGRSVRDNSLRPPSVLLSDWLDTLVPAIADDPRSEASLATARQRLVVEHPLQAFSPEAFDPAGDPRRRSHAEELAEALRQRARQAAAATGPAPAGPSGAAEADEDEDSPVAPFPRAPFFAALLPPPDESGRDIHLDELLRFFRNPCRELLRERLGVSLWQADDDLLDDEPMAVDDAVRTALLDRLLPRLLARHGTDPLNLAWAGVELPDGPVASRLVPALVREAQDFAARIEAATPQPCRPPLQVAVPVALDGETWRLRVDWSDLRADGLVRWQARRAGPSTLLAAWLHHLALCAATPPGVQPRTRWLTPDDSLDLPPVEAASQHLAHLLTLYRRGLREPLRFYPRASWACAQQDGRLDKARAAWAPARRTAFAEGDHPAYRLALRGVADPLGGDFAALALAVFGPLRALLGGGEEAA